MNFKVVYKRSNKLLFVSIIILLLSITNGTILITSNTTRLFLFILLITFTIVLFKARFTIKKEGQKNTIRLFCILIFLTSPLIFTYGVSHPLISCNSINYDCEDIISYKGENIVVYRKYGFAFTGDVLFVRKEIPLLPGVIYIENLYEEYPGNEIKLQLQGNKLRLLEPYYYSPGNHGMTLIKEIDLE